MFALRELKAEKKVLTPYVRNLASKIGISENLHIDHLNSTKKLSLQIPVKIEGPGGSRLGGMITGKNDDSFSVQVKSEKAAIKQESKVIIYVFNYRGVHFYKTKLIGKQNKILRFLHSEKMEYRKDNVNLHIFVRRESSKIEDFEKAKITSLWKGGASITNPRKKLRKEDDIRIAFAPRESNEYYTNAEVLKVRNGKTVIHIRFKHLTV